MPDPAYEAKYGKGPHLTADAAVFHRGEIALVRRRKGGEWALPGGFLDEGETFAQCALREFKEEAGVDLEADPKLIASLNRPILFDAIDRDPRSRIVSGAVLITLAETRDRPVLVAGDDAEAADWFAWNFIPRLYSDHNEMIRVLTATYLYAAPLVTTPAPLPGQLR
jgi:ADP-ribose pyrophosphatase YjhB (NUDIX family)